VIEEADAKQVDLLRHHTAEPSRIVLAGNLPYQLTGPLLRRTCGLAKLLGRVVFLVQLEVAQRLVAKADTEPYGALSVFVQSQFEVKKEFNVSPGAFYPRPHVDSAVVRLLPRQRALASETPLFQALVKAAFAQRRKQLTNAWSALPGISKQQLRDAASRAGIALDWRGERLTIEAFSRMAEELTAP
jgi:16S rRNA (adenine1518-N6/adenine1519-N6)-dimethyltransferase